MVDEHGSSAKQGIRTVSAKGLSIIVSISKVNWRGGIIDMDAWHGNSPTRADRNETFSRPGNEPTGDGTPVAVRIPKSSDGRSRIFWKV